MKKSIFLPVLFITIISMTSVPAHANDQKHQGNSEFIRLKDLEHFNTTVQNMNLSASPANSHTQPGYNVELLSLQGLIKEGSWYWVKQPSKQRSYKVDAPDFYESNKRSTIYFEPPTVYTTPTQFVNVNGQFLPHLKAYYRIVSENKIDLADVEKQLNANSTQALLALKNKANESSFHMENNPQEYSLYIDATTGQLLSSTQAAFSCCYIRIQKTHDGLHAMQIQQVMHAVNQYSYFPNGKIKSITSYNYQENEVDPNKQWTINTSFYENETSTDRLRSEPQWASENDFPIAELKDQVSENLRCKNAQ